GQVNWTDKTFERLRDAPPEPLTSSFAVTHAMVLNVLAREADPVDAMRHLLLHNHEPAERQGRHVRQAVRIYRSLRQAGVIERVRREDGAGWTVRLTQDIPQNFALNQALSPFDYVAYDPLHPASPSFAPYVIAVADATLTIPRYLLDTEGTVVHR